jgi:hypothetical protein
MLWLQDRIFLKQPVLRVDPVAGSTNYSKSWGLNSSYCVGQRSFKFVVLLNAFTTTQFSEVSSR